MAKGVAVVYLDVGEIFKLACFRLYIRPVRFLIVLFSAFSVWFFYLSGFSE